MGRGQKDRTTIRNEKVRSAADLVERDFSVPGPESTVGSGPYRHPDWLRIPLSGWAVKTHPRTRLVLDALEMALWQKHPQSVIHHSDQGTQYTSFAFDQRCRRAGIRPSMESIGDGFAKALCGSFFASQECEFLDRNRLPNTDSVPKRPLRFSRGLLPPTSVTLITGLSLPG